MSCGRSAAAWPFTLALPARDAGLRTRQAKPASVRNAPRVVCPSGFAIGPRRKTRETGSNCCRPEPNAIAKRRPVPRRPRCYGWRLGAAFEAANRERAIRAQRLQECRFRY